MFRSSRSHPSIAAKRGHTKGKLLKAVSGCNPSAVRCEPLEQRLFLSVSAAAVLGPREAPGAQWTYLATSAQGQSATFTQTVIGPASFNGISATEIDTVIAGNPNSPVGHGYYGLDAAGDYVNYGAIQTSAAGTQTDVYSPYRMGFVAMMVGGVTYDFTNTATSTIDEGEPSPPNSEDHQVTLLSETLAPVTVPAGTFDTYQGREVQTTTTPNGDGTSTITTVTTNVWYSPVVGIVKISSSNGITDVLTSFHSADHLTFTQQPTDTAKGDPIAPVTVSVMKSTGDLDADATGSITISLNKITGDGTLTGTLTKPIVNGVATFSDLTIDGGGTYTLSAKDSSSPPVTSVTSAQFEITVDALTWTGAGDGVNWSDPKNWDANIKPQNGDSLIFPAGAPLTSHNDLAGLSLESLDIQGGGYTLTGNAISLTVGLTAEAGNNTYEIDTMLVGSPKIQALAGELDVKSFLSGANISIGGNGIVTLEQKGNYTGTTTLLAGVTIDDRALTDAFGAGDLTIGAGVKPVTIKASTASSKASLDNHITFEAGAHLVTDPEFDLSRDITLKGDAYLTPYGPNDVVHMEDATLSGTGTLFLNGQGAVLLSDDIGANVKLELDSGELDLGAHLLGAAGQTQITIVGGVLQLGSSTFGSGGIDVQGGFLTTDQSTNSGTPGYSGIVTLESGGTIKTYDSADDKSLGSGKLDLQGGLLQNAAGAAVKLSNPITLEGDITLSTPLISGNDPQGMYLTGDITVTQQSTMTVSGGFFLFNALNGSNFVAFNGTGSLLFIKSIGTGVILDNVGHDYIGGQLNNNSQNTVAITLMGHDAVLELLASDISGTGAVQPLSGKGAIDVKDGTLVTDQTAGAPGLPNYSGDIIEEKNGTIKDFDAVDDLGLGKGTLDLQGGLLQDSSGAGIALDNPITLEGNVTLSGPKSATQESEGMALSGKITVIKNSVITLSGGFFLIESITGSREADFQGSGSLIFGKSISAPVVLQNSGTDSVGGVLGTNAAGLVALSIADTNTVVHLLATDLGSAGLINPLSGAGDIDVVKGTLVTDQTADAPGIDQYTGDIVLEANGTIKIYDTVDNAGLGVGTLVLKGGLLQDSSGAGVVLINEVSLEGNVTLSSPASGSDQTRGMVFDGDITVNQDSTINLSGGYFLVNNITGSKVPNFVGSGNLVFAKSITAPVVVANTGTDYLSGKLGENSAGLVALTLEGAETVVHMVSTDLGSGGVIKPLNGTGPIEVLAGTLVTDESNGAPGLPGYSGDIILDAGGALKIYDTVDHKGLGTGRLDLKGGLLQDSSGQGIALLNAITFEGNVTLSSPAAGGDQSQGMILEGDITVDKASVVTLSGGYFLINRITGSNSVNFDGTGTLIFGKSISAPLVLENVGTDLLSGQLLPNAAGLAGITVGSAATVLELVSTDLDSGGVIKPLSGSGTIVVRAGTLITDTSAGAPGLAGYSGDIEIDGGGTVKIYDSVDKFGLGTGALDVQGGLLQNSAGAVATIGNAITVSGPLIVSARDNKLKFSGALELESGYIDIFGTVALTGVITGSGGIILDGDLLGVSGSNPDFTGNVVLNSGEVQIVQDDALGTGPLTGNLSGNGLIESVSSIGDPILDNTITINKGTLQLQGQFTFTHGVTLKAGSAFDLQGANSQLVFSGPLSGAGTIIITAGSVTLTGNTSSFSGSFSLKADINRDGVVDDKDLHLLQAAMGTAGAQPADGDSNGDGYVNFADLVAVAQHYGKHNTSLSQGDFNGDGTVDFKDLVTLAQHYGHSGKSDLNGDGIVDFLDFQILELAYGSRLPSASPAAAAVLAASLPAAAIAPRARPVSMRGLKPAAVTQKTAIVLPVAPPALKSKSLFSPVRVRDSML